MATTPTIPLPALPPVIVTRISEAYQYAGGARTDIRVTDEHGQPLSRIRGIGLVLGAVQEITIEAPDTACEAIAEGDVVLAEGNLVAQLRGGDFGAISVKVLGAQRISRYATAVEIFEGLDKQARAPREK